MNYILIIGLVIIEFTIIGFGFYILHKVREPIEKLQDYTKTFSDIFLRAWETHEKMIKSEQGIYESILDSHRDIMELARLLGEQYDGFKKINKKDSEIFEKMHKVFETVAVDLKDAEDRYSAVYELFQEVSRKLDKIIPVEATLEVAAPLEVTKPGPYYGPEVKDHDEYIMYTGEETE